MFKPNSVWNSFYTHSKSTKVSATKTLFVDPQNKTMQQSYIEANDKKVVSVNTADAAH